DLLHRLKPEVLGATADVHNLPVLERHEAPGPGRLRANGADEVVEGRHVYVGRSGRSLRMISAPITVPSYVVSHACLRAARRARMRPLRVLRSSGISRARRPL